MAHSEVDNVAAYIQGLLPKALCNSTTYYVLVTDSQGRYLYVNPLYRTRFSFVGSDFVGEFATDTIHADDVEKCLNAAAECLTNPDSTVNVILRKPTGLSGQFRVSHWEFSALHDRQGATMGVLAIGHDYTITEELGEKLRSLEALNARMANEITDGFYRLDREWRFTSVNAEAESILGLSAQELVGKVLWDLFPESTEFNYPYHFRRAMETGAAQTFDDYRPDLDRWFHVVVYPEPDGICVCFKDVSAELKARQAVEQSEARLRQIAENITDVVFTTDLQFNLTYISPSTFQLTGETVEEALARKFEDRHPPETCEAMRRMWEEELARDENPNLPRNRTRIVEVQGYHKDGRILDLEMHASFLRDAQGKPTGVLGVSRDITELKRARRNLEITNNRFEELAEHSRTVVWEVDNHGLYTYISPSAQKLYGLPVKDIVGKLHFYDFIPPDEREEVKRDIFEILRTKKALNGYEKRQQTPAVHSFWVSATAYPIADSRGRIVGFRGSCTEITKRKEAELKLVKSNQRFEELALRSRTIMWEMSPQGVYKFISPLAEEIFGIPLDTIIGKATYRNLLPAGSDDTTLLAMERILAQGEPFEDFEWLMASPTGEKIWLNSRGYPIKDDSGAITMWRGSTTEITRRKNAEVESSEANRRFEELALLSRSVTWEVDPNGKYTYLSKSAESVYGYPPDEIIGHLHFYDLCPVEEREAFRQMGLELMAARKNFDNLENRVVCKGGEARWFLRFGQPAINSEGACIGYSGTDIDITERKRNRMELIAQKDYTRSILEAIPDMLFVLTLDGVFLEAKEGKEQAFILPESQFLGKSLHDVLPPTLATQVMESLSTIEEGREPQPLQYHFDIGGKLVHYEVRLAGFGADKAVAVVRDITTRINAEQALREREQLLRELVLEKDRIVKLQDVLIGIATEFINLPMDGFDTSIVAALERLGGVLGYDMAAVFQFDDSRSNATRTHKWDPHNKLSPEFCKVSLSDFGEWIPKLMRGNILALNDIAELSKTSLLRIALEIAEVQAIISYPLMDRTQCIGIVNFYRHRPIREMHHSVKPVMEVFSHALVNIILRKRMEENLRHTEKLLEQTSRMALIGAFDFNLETGALYWSNVLKEMMDMPPDYTPTLEEALAFYKEGESRDKVIAGFENAKCTGAPFDEEAEVVTARGRHIWVHGLSSTVQNEQGITVRMYGTLQDITTVKKTQQEQQELLAITQAQNQRLRNFSHIVAHNLRSHSGNMEALVQLHYQNHPELLREELSVMLQRASKNLQETVGHLSEVAVLSAFEPENEETIDLAVAISKAVTNVAALARNADAEFETRCPDHTFVRGTPAYVDSALLNLLTNAIKYKSPERMAKIEIEVNHNQGYTIVSVRDNGLGIDLSRHGDKLFGMFKTFHNHPEAKGIGLFMTKNQVEAMGGKITVESTPGMGTTFHIYLKSAPHEANVDH